MTDTLLTAPDAPAAASSVAPSSPFGAEQPDMLTHDYSSLAFPEGVMVDASLMDNFKGLAGEHGLSCEGAQKMMDLHMQAVEAQQAIYQQTINDWVHSVADDPEIGGAHQAQALGLAKQALDTFGTPALMDALNQSGLGNHPELIRAFYRMGKAIAEDGRKTHGNGLAVDPLRALYPTMFKD